MSSFNGKREKRKGSYGTGNIYVCVRLCKCKKKRRVDDDAMKNTLYSVVVASGSARICDRSMAVSFSSSTRPTVHLSIPFSQYTCLNPIHCHHTYKLSPRTRQRPSGTTSVPSIENTRSWHFSKITLAFWSVPFKVPFLKNKSESIARLLRSTTSQSYHENAAIKCYNKYSL